MIVSMYPGAHRDDVVTTLRSVASALRNLSNASGDTQSRLTAYLEWATDSARMLEHRIYRADINRLVFSQRYELILNAPGSLTDVDNSHRKLVSSLLDREVEHQPEEIETAIRYLEAQTGLSPGDVVNTVADTSVFVNHGEKSMIYQKELQAALSGRLHHLMEADYEDGWHEVSFVTRWIHAQPALNAILTEAQHAEPGLAPDALVSVLLHRDFRDDNHLGRRIFKWPSRTEAGRALLIWHLMRRITAEEADEADSRQLFYAHTYVLDNFNEPNDQWRNFVERIIRPLFNYLSERVGEESRILYVLGRYVHLVEWFDRKDLYERAMQDTQKAEEVYDSHLRRFLFAEGINMPFSQAKSASGESDILTNLDSGDPLVCEVKVYDAHHRTKRNLASGIHQAISYANDYGKQVAYLVIINISGRLLSLPAEGDPKLWPPRITIAGTRVYLIAVRALATASASEQGKPAPVIVTRDDLVDPRCVDEP